MDKLIAILLIILGTAGIIVAVGLAVVSYAINEPSREEQQDYGKYVLRNGVIVEEHDVSGLIEED